MELSFLSENPSNRPLNSNEYGQFYERLKKLVVIIESDVDSSNSMIGGGVFIDETGLILTCDHLVRDKVRVTFRAVDEVRFIPAKIVYCDSDTDLAILKPDTKKPIPLPYPFASFSSPDTIRLGMEALSISHAGGLFYTFAIGQVVYPCDPFSSYTGLSALETTATPRFVADIRTPLDKDPESYAKDLKFIQINNVHGSPGSSGCPIFNSAGQVIGLTSFICGGFDFALHVNELTEFIRTAPSPVSGPSSSGNPKRKKRKKSRDQRSRQDRR